MQSISKIPVLILLSILGTYSIISNGCKQGNTKTSSDASATGSLKYDTLQKISIDSTINRINAGVKAQGRPSSLHFPVYHPNDSIKYWTNNGEPSRISLAMQDGENVTWPTFFISNGELVQVRYRATRMDDPNPFVEERMTYLKSGKIVYCEERAMIMKEGDYPGLLRRKGYTVCTRTAPEIEKDYIQYWNSVKEALNTKTGKIIK